jgi:hypothetical protein
MKDLFGNPLVFSSFALRCEWMTKSSWIVAALKVIYLTVEVAILSECWSARNADLFIRKPIFRYKSCRRFSELRNGRPYPTTFAKKAGFGVTSHPEHPVRRSGSSGARRG